MSHSPTELYCGREELALLGKLFRLINERMRFDELNVQFYLKLFRRFVEFQHQRLGNGGNLKGKGIVAGNKIEQTSKSSTNSKSTLSSVNLV